MSRIVALLCACLASATAWGQAQATVAFKSGAAEFEWEGKACKVPVDVAKDPRGQPASSLMKMGQGWMARLAFRQNPGRDDYVTIQLMNATGGAAPPQLMGMDVRVYPGSPWRLSPSDHACNAAFTKSGAEGFEGTITCTARKGPPPPFAAVRLTARP